MLSLWANWLQLNSQLNSPGRFFLAVPYGAVTGHTRQPSCKRHMDFVTATRKPRPTLKTLAKISSRGFTALCEGVIAAQVWVCEIQNA